MKIENMLSDRSGSSCELCSNTDDLIAYQVPPKNNDTLDGYVHMCKTCQDQIENPESVNVNHWRCLNESAWSEVPAVQVVSWRMLHHLKNEGWTADLLDTMYLEDETLEWAKATGIGEDIEDQVIHKDSNGVILEAGDTVVLIKDLNVKGTSMVAKRGTAVRRISLVQDNPEHIEGKVNDQRIVILTQFVKKSK